MNPENQQRGYSKDPIPLADYGILVGALNAAIALTAAGSGKDGRLLPGAKPFDFLVLALATHKLARLISKDKVTSALRAPFSRLEGGAGAGELDEVERGHGMRHTLGRHCPRPRPHPQPPRRQNLHPRPRPHRRRPFSPSGLRQIKGLESPDLTWQTNPWLDTAAVRGLENARLMRVPCSKP